MKFLHTTCICCTSFNEATVFGVLIVAILRMNLKYSSVY